MLRHDGGVDAAQHDFALRMDFPDRFRHFEDAEIPVCHARRYQNGIEFSRFFQKPDKMLLRHAVSFEFSRNKLEDRRFRHLDMEKLASSVTVSSGFRHIWMVPVHEIEENHLSPGRFYQGCHAEQSIRFQPEIVSCEVVDRRIYKQKLPHVENYKLYRGIPGSDMNGNLKFQSCTAKSLFCWTSRGRKV